MEDPSICNKAPPEDPKIYVRPSEPVELAPECPAPPNVDNLHALLTTQQKQISDLTDLVAKLLKK